MAARISNALDILDRRHPVSAEDEIAMAEISLSLSLAEQVYACREASGLSQAELAKRLKTSQSAISRLESQNYRGYTLSTLARLFHVLGYELEVSVKPISQSQARRKPAPASQKPSRSGSSTGSQRIAAKGR